MQSSHRSALALAAAACAALALVLTPATATAGGQILYVGTGPDCTHGTIAAALLTAALTTAPDEIRLTRTISYTNQYIHLTNWDPSTSGAITIRGGYDDCSISSPTGRTLVSGQSSHAVFEIDTTGGYQSIVHLKDLEIRDSGQRGVLVEGASTVSLENAYIRYNDGGGVELTSGATVTMDRPSWIRQNTGSISQGGGIRCSGATLTIGGPISENEATYGGGVYGTSSCDITMVDGGWIQSNTASFGGGVYLNGGADLHTIGGGGWSVLINGNTATTDGGGILASGTGTSVVFNNSRLTNNVANMHGGGIYAINSAQVEMGRNAISPCYDAERCSLVSGNTLTTPSDGIAVYADSGAHVTMYDTYVEGNSGPGNAGTLFYAVDTGSTLSLEGLSIWDNGAVSILAASGSASIRGGFLTMAGNNSTAGHSKSARATASGTVGIYTSLLWDTNGADPAGGTINGDCIAANTTTGLPAVASIVTIPDPKFIDAASGDLHLRASSPAVDFCDAINYAPSQAGDIDWQFRFFDLPSVPNDPYGAYDLGADELWPLFSDGFESGNTSAWSSVAP